MASEAMRRISEQIRAVRSPGGRDLAIAERRAGMEAVAPPAPADASTAPADANGVPAEWIAVPGCDPGRRLLYLHGGGYAMGSLRTHRRLAADVARATGCVVLSADYRLAPEHPFPAALDDARAAFAWMRAHGPDGAAPARSTFIAGDSAGGGLTLAALVALRDAGEALPSAAVTFSAWTDLTGSGESVTTRADADPMIDPAAMPATAADYHQATPASDPLVSPLFADLAGLPPLLLQVGDAEVLLSDSTRFAERAAAAGVDVTCEVEPEAFHVYQYMAEQIPEARAALERVGAFVRARG